MVTWVPTFLLSGDKWSALRDDGKALRSSRRRDRVISSHRWDLGCAERLAGLIRITVESIHPRPGIHFLAGHDDHTQAAQLPLTLYSRSGALRPLETLLSSGPCDCGRSDLCMSVISRDRWTSRPEDWRGGEGGGCVRLRRTQVTPLFDRHASGFWSTAEDREKKNTNLSPR